MNEPIFWLGLSVGLVAAGIFAVVVTLLPAVIQLGRAAKSVERFFDTLLRELPPTLEALRLTTLEVSEIADSVDDGVKGASQVVKSVGQSIDSARQQATSAQISTRSMVAGVKAGWQAFTAEEKTTRPRIRSNPPTPLNPARPNQLPDGSESRSS